MPGIHERRMLEALCAWQQAAADCSHQCPCMKAEKELDQTIRDAYEAGIEDQVISAVIGEPVEQVTRRRVGDDQRPANAVHPYEAADTD